MAHRVLLLAAVAISSVSGGGQDGKELATRPAASRPATRPVRELITQLGDKDFRRRQEAGRELERKGDAAMDALTEAKVGGDPEGQVRAEQIVQRIIEGRRDEAVVAKRRAIDPGFPQPGRPRVISARNSGAAETEISVEAGDHKTVMRCTRDGFIIRNRKVVNGDEKVEVCRAVSRDELKRLHPVVYDFYVETILEMTGGDDATEETIRRQMVWFEQFLTPPRAEDLR